MSVFALGAIFFAVLDQIIVRGTFLKRMRMSRRELRREARDREGEPRLRQKRKQLHRELTKSRQSLRSLHKADVLITNPQHIALALHYDPKTMPAPKVVSVGLNHFAQRLKRLAFLYNIPIVENRALAQALYRKAALNGTIPPECFRPVADIYNAIRERKRAAGLETANA
jgi:flagellar biosynthetic protein FlhB